MQKERDYFIPKEASKYLNCDPYNLNLLAKEDKLPFPYIMVGNRLKIPKKSFLEWLGIEEDGAEQCN